MKRLFTKYGMMLLSLAVLIAVLLSAMVYFSSTSGALPNVAGVVASPFRSVISSVTETVSGWVGYFTEYDALKEENQRLEQELAEKDELIRQAEADRDENQRLRELLNLREQRRDLSFESARVVEADGSNWSALLTINKGTAQDITVGDCVVTEAGYLVGEIIETGLNWSTVRTVVDSDTSIGAFVFRTGVTAVAQGDFALMSENRLKLGYLGAEGNVMTGDLIVTSGLGGYNPAEIVIGYVEEVATGDDGLSQYAVIRPEADLASLSQVFVITDFTIVD